MSKVRKTETCWEWTAAMRDPNNYGEFFQNNPRRMVGAHIVSYRMFKGETNGLCVLHKCDNRRCVNPDHLFLGTRKDNMQDCLRKMRLPSVGKITQADADKIRTMSGTQESIAAAFGIHQSGVSRILNRKTWARQVAS